MINSTFYDLNLFSLFIHLNKVTTAYTFYEGGYCTLVGYLAIT